MRCTAHMLLWHVQCSLLANTLFAAQHQRCTAQLHVVCKRASGSGSVPGNLLRFDATIKLSSAANRTLFAQDAVKGIVMGEAANRTSYMPIDISQLPYNAKGPVRALLHMSSFEPKRIGGNFERSGFAGV